MEQFKSLVNQRDTTSRSKMANDGERSFWVSSFASNIAAVAEMYNSCNESKTIIGTGQVKNRTKRLKA